MYASTSDRSPRRDRQSFAAGHGPGRIEVGMFTDTLTLLVLAATQLAGLALLDGRSCR